MTEKSILEYEEAKRRLQQLERDQAVLSQLVVKLKQFSEDAEAKMAAIDERQQRFESLLLEAEGKVSEIRGVLTTLQSQGNTTLEKMANDAEAGLSLLEESKAKIETECDRTRQQLSDTATELRHALEKQQQDWCANQDSEFRKFADQHLGDMETVAKAYDRQKAVFENVKVSAESLAQTVEIRTRENSEAIDGLRDELMKRADSSDRALDKKLDSARQEFNEQNVSLTENLESRAQSLQQQLDRLKDAHSRLKGSARTWLFVIGFVAAAAVGLAVFGLFSAGNP